MLWTGTKHTSMYKIRQMSNFVGALSPKQAKRFRKKLMLIAHHVFVSRGEPVITQFQLIILKHGKVGKSIQKQDWFTVK